VRLCYCWVCSSQANSLTNHPADIVYLFHINRLKGRMWLHIEIIKYIFACIIARMINVSCMAPTLCSTSWTNLWQNPKLVSFLGQ
jgi:hypothetical protein